MYPCDIIIPVWNRLEDTKDCVNSIRKNTSYPYRILIVDNGSEHETSKCLNAFEKEDPGRIKVLRNDKNLGFVKAVNKGIAFSEAEFVCLLNNDTIVNPGWLGELIKVGEKDLKIGIVNPSSNTLGQPCPRMIVPSKEQKESGSFVELGSAFGFCMLIKKEILKDVGLFDESYGMGYFEDTDFSLRAKEKGYKSVRAIASYVYHKEKRSFSLLKSFKADFLKNKKIFELKWGKTKRITVVSKSIDSNFLNYLNDIAGKYAKGKSWLYVITPKFNTKEFFEKYSNLTFYNFKKAFYFLTFLKIIFKKKKIDFILCDNRFFLDILKWTKVFHNAKSGMIGDTL